MLLMIIMKIYGTCQSVVLNGIMRMLQDFEMGRECKDRCILTAKATFITMIIMIIKITTKITRRMTTITRMAVGCVGCVLRTHAGGMGLDFGGTVVFGPVPILFLLSMELLGMAVKVLCGRIVGG